MFIGHPRTLRILNPEALLSPGLSPLAAHSPPPSSRLCVTLVSEVGS